jgi:hypothetical protein
MKRLTTIFAFLLMVAFTVNAQNLETTTPTLKKVVTKTSDNTYSVEVKNADGLVIQAGEYLKNGTELIPHGTWTLYAHNSTDVLTRIKYEKGEKIWLETKIDGQFKRMDNNEIKIHQLESKIVSLEKKIDSIE